VTSNLRDLSKKKPYQKPNLRSYGDIAALTKTIHMGHKTDHMGGLAVKTN
jgi:hypothetical protein